MDYRIEKKDAFNVIAMLRNFTQDTSQSEIPKFWGEYMSNGSHEKVCGMMGLCEQAKEGSNSWRYGIGCEEKYVTEIPEGFEVLEIPAHNLAIFKCVGPMPHSIQDMWKRVYSEWLPASNYELIHDYDIEYYTEGDTQSNDYISEIWIPVSTK